MVVFGMIVCLAAIIAIIILSIIRIQLKWLAVVVAVVLSCVVMMPFSCCAGKWYDNYKTESVQRAQMKKQLKQQQKELEKAQKAQKKAGKLPDQNNL